MSDIVQKLWGSCHMLRHDGVDDGDYIDQITYLLFLKMANDRGVPLPKACGWPNLAGRSGTALVDDWTDQLRRLGQQRGILGDIYARLHQQAMHLDHHDVPSSVDVAPQAHGEQTRM